MRPFSCKAAAFMARKASYSSVVLGAQRLAAAVGEGRCCEASRPKHVPDGSTHSKLSWTATLCRWLAQQLPILSPLLVPRALSLHEVIQCRLHTAARSYSSCTRAARRRDDPRARGHFAHNNE